LPSPAAAAPSGDPGGASPSSNHQEAQQARAASHGAASTSAPARPRTSLLGRSPGREASDADLPDFPPPPPLSSSSLSAVWGTGPREEGGGPQFSLHLPEGPNAPACLNVPPEWQQAIEQICQAAEDSHSPAGCSNQPDSNSNPAGGAPPPSVVLCGAKGSGKSSLARVLVNSLLNHCPVRRAEGLSGGLVAWGEGKGGMRGGRRGNG
jgi:hypothetical protein